MKARVQGSEEEGGENLVRFPDERQKDDGRKMCRRKVQ